MATPIEFRDMAASLALDIRAIQAGDLTPTLRDVRAVVLQGHRDNFTSSASPDGQNWQHRKIDGDGHPLLMDTGALLQAATGGGPGHITRIAPRELEVGVDTSVDLGGVSAGGFHQEGTATMPARPWLGVGPEGLDAIDIVIADGIEKLLGSR